MAKYRFLRDRSANGTAKNTVIAPAGQIVPSNLYLTKQYKKGDIVEGVVSGNSISISVNDATQTTGQPYIGTVNLTTTIYDTKDDVTTYWMEEIDSSGNALKSDKTTATTIFTTKNVVIGVVVIIGIYAILKWQKMI